MDAEDIDEVERVFAIGVGIGAEVVDSFHGNAGVACAGDLGGGVGLFDGFSAVAYHAVVVLEGG